MPSSVNGKPQIAESDILAVLRERFATPIEDLAVVSGGQIAQTYGFSAGGERYILRITQHMGANLDKEQFIQRLLAASPVPVAPILQVGRLGDLHYAISQRMPGAPLTALPPDAFEELIAPDIDRPCEATSGARLGILIRSRNFCGRIRRFFPILSKRSSF